MDHELPGGLAWLVSYQLYDLGVDRAFLHNESVELIYRHGFNLAGELPDL